MADPSGYRERTLTAQDGLRLYFRDYGDPAWTTTPVLCLGGLTRNAKDFDRLAADLARTRRVLCPDYRGRGRSQYDLNWRNYQPAVYLNDIRHLLAATNCHRVAVIGTSMGGLLATALAAMAPTAVAGVVLNDVGPDLNDGAVTRILNYVGRDRPQKDWDGAVAHLKEILPLLGLKSEEDWQRFARSTFREGKDGQLHYDWDVNLVKPLISPAEPLPDLWRLFRALRTLPAAVVRGENSDVLTAPTLVRMLETVPHMKDVTISGMGHAPTLEEPEARDLIDTVLAQA
ncbi:MAG: alpha/beta hydrolase [Alphaproteobacteria bacterium]|nr:alpha/beta hydrolase [Alphaproteobacteria bacterium]